MATGWLLRFDDTKGFGFIAPDDGGPDVIVHADDLLVDAGMYAAGMQVEFDVADSDRGLKATGVRLRDRARPRQSERDEAQCDTMDGSTFQREITDALLGAVPTLSGAEVVRIHAALLHLADRHSWIKN